MTKDDDKKRKAVEKAEADLRRAQEKAATDSESNSDAVRKAEAALADARSKTGQHGPGKHWPPDGLEFKTPKDTEKK